MAVPTLSRRKNKGMQRHREMFHPLEREMGRLWDDFWRHPFSLGERWGDAFLPAVDVHEDDNHIRVVAELPGMEDKDLEVTVRRDSVRITGEKKQETETDENGFHRRETSYGAFDRLIDLPTEVDEEKAEADFKNGVLTIALPKDEASKTKTRKIPIKTNK